MTTSSRLHSRQDALSRRWHTSPPGPIDLFANVANEYPKRSAVLSIDGSCLWTFGDLARGADDLAGRLHAAGVGAGDTVLALPASRREAIRMAAGVLWAGAALVVAPASMGIRAGLRAALDAQPTAVIAEPLTWGLAMLQPGLLRIPIRITVGWRKSTRCDSVSTTHHDRMLRMPCPLDPAMISFTTGTTGQPKRIVRTHAVLSGQHHSLDALRNVADGDVDLAGMPMLALHNLARGVTSLLPPRGKPTGRGFSRTVVESIERNAVTSAAGFPSLFEAVVGAAQPSQLTRLRSIHIGGSVVRPDLIRRLQVRAPNAEITVVYGSTEAEPMAAIGADEYLAHESAACAGRGICVGRPRLEVKIAPTSSQAVAGLAATSDHDSRDAQRVAARSLTERNIRWGREVGAILVRGTQVVATAPTDFIDTGDVGWLDDAGRLWLMGRAAHVGPGPLYPAEVEPVVTTLPGVKNAAMTVLVGDGRRRAAIAVETGVRTTAAQRATARSELQRLSAAQGWEIADFAIAERLPRDRRTGSKIDYGRLATLFGQ